MKETKYWSLHIFAGIALLFLLGFHFLYSHIGNLLFNVEDNISKEMSEQRDSQVTFLIFFVFLLGFGLYHGLYGLKNILNELISCKATQNVLTFIITIIGIALFIFGSFYSYQAHINAKAKTSEVKNVK